MKQAAKTMRLGKFFGLILGVSWALPLAAQTTNVTLRTISLDECIEMALQNNFALRIERYNIELVRSDLKQAETLYDPLFNFRTRSAQRTSLNQAWSVIGERTVAKDHVNRDIMEFEVSGLGPMGLSYNLPLQFERTFGPNFKWLEQDLSKFPFITYHDRLYKEYRATAAVELRQPLLKDFLIDGARRTVMVSKKLLKMSEYTYQVRMMEIITAVRLAYCDLIFARESVKVQEKALELAEKLLNDNKAKVRAGTLPPLDEKQAESQVAITRADLLSARQFLMTQENLLKNLITRDLPEWKNISLVPTELLVAVPEALDVQESWRTGFIKRPDLAQLRVDLERRDIEIRYRKNQTLPDLSLITSYGHNALGNGAEDLLYDVHKDKSPFYYYGIELSFPLGNREAKYRLAQRKDERAQAELVVQQLQQNIMVQIDDAISSAKSSFDRVAATRQASEYAELAWQAEQKKLENGKSTSFFVLQFQRDLTTARSQEIRALADYNKALARVAQAEGTALERLKINVQFK
jgi:outer membrane protein TolC